MDTKKINPFILGGLSRRKNICLTPMLTLPKTRRAWLLLLGKKSGLREVV